MRIAATADLHFVPSSHSAVLDQLGRVRDNGGGNTGTQCSDFAAAGAAAVAGISGI